MVAARAIPRTVVLLVSLLAALPAAAQQTGEISGKVTDTSGGILPGVTVEARSDVLPSPRVTVTESRDHEATYQVDSDHGVDVRREVAGLVVRGGWGLLELRPSRLSLEDVFVKLMTDENTEAPAVTSESTEVAGA